MLKKQRLSQILDLLDEHGIMNVVDLATALEVSEMTVRRDLDELENNGRLLRFHGGAQSIDTAPEKDDITPHIPHIAEKRQIARAASKLIEPQDVIYMGSGTTVSMLARIMDQPDLLVVTNSFQVFKILSKTMPDKVLLTGGQLRSKSGAFIGSITSSVLRSMKFSAAFISCSAIHNEDMMVSSMEEGDIEKIALHNSRHKYLLADHTKFNTDDFYIVGRLQDMDLIITDASLAPEVEEQYAKFAKVLKSSQSGETLLPSVGSLSR